MLGQTDRKKSQLLPENVFFASLRYFLQPLTRAKEHCEKFAKFENIIVHLVVPSITLEEVIRKLCISYIFDVLEIKLFLTRSSNE